MRDKIDWDKVNSPTLKFSRFDSRRSVVYGRKGVVSCSQPLAAEAGLEILRKGGNAVDAAVAVSAALNVTEPSCCGIGGDAFCLFYDAKTKQVKALNGSGRSPVALTLEAANDMGIKGESIPLTNLNSVTVPGACAAWFDSVEALGSKNLSFSEILEPAIRLAEEGVPVSEIHSHAWQESESLIRNASPDHNAMLLHGRAPLPGEVMTFPDLAKTFRTIAAEGKPGFYTGRIAQAIVDLIKSKGGLMELSDLATHESQFVEPISYTYDGEVTVYECPPNGQGIYDRRPSERVIYQRDGCDFLGITALIALGILDVLQDSGKVQSLLKMEHNSVEYLHTLIETMRLAFADSRYYVTDPDVVHVPVKELLSKGYLQARAEQFNPLKAIDNVKHGTPVQSSDTVYFSVTDEQGNGCSFIQSNYAGFGTGAIPHGCGFTLQNRGSGFSLRKGHPNQLQGGKRPYHTIIPALAMRGDDLFLVYGVMGGFMQPQGHVQVLLNILRGYSVQAALDAPRFCISAGLPNAEVKPQESTIVGDVNSEIYFETGIQDSVVAKLKEMGHDARKLEGFARGMFGRGQVIQKLSNPEGRLVWAAGSDSRADGHSVAQI